MSRVVRFAPGARHEVKDAFRWYESRSIGVGAGFMDEVDAATQRLEENPDAFRLERGKYRRIHLRRFPYALHFSIQQDGTVIVLACLHFRQSPDRWPGA